MKPLIKSLTLSDKEFFITHIHIVNALLPVKLSQKEIEVLAVFMSFTGTLAQDRFSTTGKKMVKEILNLSPQSLWNYIKSLKEKKLVYPNGQNKLEIMPILFPQNRNQQKYIIQLTNTHAD